MSGPRISRALQNRFEDIRRAELARLKKKLAGLNEEELRSVDAITAQVVRAIAQLPARALADTIHQPALEAVVRLFALEADVRRPA